MEGSKNTYEAVKNSEGIYEVEVLAEANEMIDAIPGFADLNPHEKKLAVDEQIMDELSKDNKNRHLADAIAYVVEQRIGENIDVKV